MNSNIIKFLLTISFAFQYVIGVQAQSKKELEEDLAKKTAQMDTMNARLASLEAMYSFVADSLLKHDFNPTDFQAIVDSANLDHTNALKAAAEDQKTLQDSINVLQERVAFMDNTINNSIEILNLTSNREVTRAEVEQGLDAHRKAVIKELKQLKDLFESEILTQEEYEEKRAKVLEKW